MNVRWADSVQKAAQHLNSYDAVTVRSKPGQSVLILFCNEQKRDEAQAVIGGKKEGPYEGYPGLASRASNLFKRLQEV